jgi:hypothetical protein
MLWSITLAAIYAAASPSEDCPAEPPDKMADNPDICMPDADAGHMPEASIVELDRCRSVMTCQDTARFGSCEHCPVHQANQNACTVYPCAQKRLHIRRILLCTHMLYTSPFPPG